MREIETDYLVIGAGASGMAFVDSVITGSDADVVMVDRQHRPGGHWLNAYPFVRLHMPSANYGVNSRALGNDRIDTSGPNAGFYERATAGEICDYFNRVMDEQFLPSGRVRFFPMSEYRGADGDGHHFVSLLTGERTTVKVRRRLVDATFTESEIPSRHTPSFEVDAGVRFIAPNDLVEEDGAASGYTIIGGGKTSMDTCTWLLDQGVAPDTIRWIRSRDAWTMNREYFQPLDHVGSYMEFQAAWVAAASEAETAAGFAHRLGENGMLVRLDPDVEPTAFRGAILSALEVDALRTIENVVRLGRVLRIGADGVTLEEGTIPSGPAEVYVDCSAAGVPSYEPRPIFEPNRITMQFVTLGIVPWSAATIGAVEVSRPDDDDKNRLCPPLVFTGRVSDLLEMMHAGVSGLVARTSDPDIGAWNEACRLNPSAGAAGRMDDPRVAEAFGTLATQIGPALENLERRVREPSAV